MTKNLYALRAKGIVLVVARHAAPLQAETYG
jgi:hypothetical protein